MDSYIFKLFITHKQNVLEKTFFKIEIMNLQQTPRDLFQIHQPMLVHPNCYLNKYGLAFFSHIFLPNSKQSAFNITNVRVNVLKKLFKNQSLLDDHPKDFSFKADFSYYNYYIIIQNIYKSFFKDTELYKQYMFDQIQSTALKSVDVFQNAFDSLEERYVDILRPHINAFVAYFSEIIKEYDPENFIGLSGGDTYRRWSDIVKKTADIDTKLYLPKRQRKLMDRLVQEMCLFSFHLKNNVFQNGKSMKQFDITVDNKPCITFKIQNTNFRMRCYTKTIFPVDLYSIDARCVYLINKKKYNYDYSCLDIPVDTFKHLKKNFGFVTVSEYIPFPIKWVHNGGDITKMDIDIKNNNWVHYNKCNLFIPSPKLLKIDIEKIYENQDNVLNRELAGKRPKDSIRYDAITDACKFYEHDKSDENYKKTRIDQNVIDMLNIADLNTYLFMWSINKTKSNSYYFDMMDKNFIYQPIKMFGMYKIIKMTTKSNKFKIPFTFQTVEKMYNLSIESEYVPVDKKLKRMKKYCRAVKKFAKRLLKDSKFDEELMSQFINCKQILQKQIQESSNNNQESSNNNQESSNNSL